MVSTTSQHAGLVVVLRRLQHTAALIMPGKALLTPALYAQDACPAERTSDHRVPWLHLQLLLF